MSSVVGVQDELAEFEEIAPEEGRELLDGAARGYLNMTAEEFISAWDEGRIQDPDSLRVQQVAMLLPFGR